MLLPQEIIRKKRQGETLRADEITWFVKGMSSGTVSDGQIGAFAMAVYFQGMTMDERIALTLAMRDSGHVLSWPNFDAPIVDKHSTGGVGDVVSLMLGPMVAACGAKVPMISGRGLGHTGGTLDKLESIPGYNPYPTAEKFSQIVKQTGVAIIGQTDALAPADKRFYSIRDVTATVESIDLITASILSKKLAADLDSLVMDIKVGDGAFMPSFEKSQQLAQSIVNVARGAGTATTAVLTDMNQVLARSAGNAIEVREAVNYLSGVARDERLHEVTLTLGAHMLTLSKLAPTYEQAVAQLQQVLDNGQALDVFSKMVYQLGGPIDFSENMDKYLPKAPLVIPLPASQSGFISAIKTRDIGLAVVNLGGGRTRAEQKINPAVGLDAIIKIGEPIEKGEPLLFAHVQSQEQFENIEQFLSEAFSISATMPEKPPVIYETVAN